ncbi:glycerol-3-phosphate dehydrogenase [Tersicoccus solisilvae]|uniref:Glycerol-3-phosphate dehydrogenase n=1 Tax=Tersicoccus solisilvae TaxID=1882339 RepID=A0ABQ1PHS6_9MICC|nr:FAD-dependent oxidoreductase [Tersicoccus solisilvae]GGC97333.1 glycerol-3-phosphate dehydrogenase [Tersicoccus solisilvae]
MDTDVLIIGSGITGLSLAAALAPHTEVVIVEAEPAVAYRQSARAARQLEPTIDPPVLRALQRRSAALIAGPAGEAARPRRRVFAGADQQVRDLAAAGGLTVAEDAAGVLRQAGARDTTVAAATDEALEIDAGVLQDRYRDLALDAGTEIIPVADVHTAARTGDGWVIGAGQEGITARTVVNAAGAWADPIAVVAAVEIQGLQPHRHTAAVFALDAPIDPDTPLFVRDGVMIRPDGDGLLVASVAGSPGNAGFVPPSPAAVENLRRAAATLTGHPLGDLDRAWTAVRTRGRDGLPVVGYDGEADGFFWLAGQGDGVVHTAPALADLAAGMILERQGTERGETADATAAGRDDEPSAEAILAALSPVRRMPTRPSADLGRTPAVH